MRTLFGVVREELPNPKFCSANVAFDKTFPPYFVPGGLTVPSLVVLINANEVTAVKCSFLLCRRVTELYNSQFDGLSNSHYRRLTAPRFLRDENTPDWKLWKL